MKKFIKVVDPELSKLLAAQGFQYIKEENGYAFIPNERLISFLQEKYAEKKFVTTNKLTF